MLGRAPGPQEPFPEPRAGSGGRAAGAAAGMGTATLPLGGSPRLESIPPRAAVISAPAGPGHARRGGGALPGAEWGRPRPRPPRPCSSHSLTHSGCIPAARLPPVPPARLGTGRVNQPSGAFPWAEFGKFPIRGDALSQKSPPSGSAPKCPPLSLLRLGRAAGRRSSAQMRGKP